MNIYFEIQADDINRAKSFYKSIFNWQFVKNDLAPIEYYWIEANNIRGGILSRPVPKPQGMCGTNAFCCSFEVQNIDEIIANILKNGGQIAMSKFAIPNTCWHAYFLDTEGNVFGIFEPDENAK